MVRLGIDLEIFNFLATKSPLSVDELQEATSVDQSLLGKEAREVL